VADWRQFYTAAALNTDSNCMEFVPTKPRERWISG
jgi:hypothetical protein